MVIRALFGTKGERDIKRIRPIIERINALEPEMQALDEALRGKTAEFRGRIREMLGCEPRELIQEIALRDRRRLLEALMRPAGGLCVVRETAWRTIKQRPYDVQLRRYRCTR